MIVRSSSGLLPTVGGQRTLDRPIIIIDERQSVFKNINVMIPIKGFILLGGGLEKLLGD